MRNKNAIIFLIVGSSFWVLSDIYYLIQRVVSDSWSYYKNHLGDLCISSLNIIIPISLLVFAISLITNKTELPTSEIVDSNPTKGVKNMTIADWLVTFLITLIPFGGLVALIMWANDDSNKVKKNWAIASLIYQGILLVFFLFIYVFIIASFKSRLF